MVTERSVRQEAMFRATLPEVGSRALDIFLSMLADDERSWIAGSSHLLAKRVRLLSASLCDDPANLDIFKRLEEVVRFIRDHSLDHDATVAHDLLCQTLAVSLTSKESSWIRNSDHPVAGQLREMVRDIFWSTQGLDVHERFTEMLQQAHHDGLLNPHSVSTTAPAP